MADTDPSFYDIMSKELGGDEAFNAFTSDKSRLRPGFVVRAWIGICPGFIGAS
jgi:hypothetical protein